MGKAAIGISGMTTMIWNILVVNICTTIQQRWHRRKPFYDGDHTHFPTVIVSKMTINLNRGIEYVKFLCM